jgi:hypothetical protein
LTGGSEGGKNYSATQWKTSCAGRSFVASRLSSPRTIRRRSSSCCDLGLGPKVSLERHIYEMESTETTTSLESSERNFRISTATENDLEILGEMGYQFAELYGKSLMKFRASIFTKKMKDFMQAGQGTVLCLHQNKWDLKGAIAGVLYENVFDGEPCATELFWYVWPGAARGAGKALLDAFEDWARFRKATRVTMAYMLHNAPERLAHFYERHGYQAFESHYVKML